MPTKKEPQANDIRSQVEEIMFEHLKLNPAFNEKTLLALASLAQSGSIDKANKLQEVITSNIDIEEK